MKNNDLEILEQNWMPLEDVTFLIPLRIESQDRMRNIITTMIYLLRNFNTNVMIKEYDMEQIFMQSAFPTIEDAVGDKVKNINYIFEKTDEFIFHRTRLLNDMIQNAETPIVVNYDSDVLLPKETYLHARHLILNGYTNPEQPNIKPEPIKVVYPYGYGNFQFQISATDEEVTNFINSNFNFTAFTSMRQYDAKFGFCQFFDREEYIRFGMENENFVSYGYEDDERYNRFNTLSHVARINDYVYHLEHVRTQNSWFNNPHIESNRFLWEKLKILPKENIIEYYNNQKYLIDRGVICGQK
jgi:hypothetical protein